VTVVHEPDGVQHAPVAARHGLGEHDPPAVCALVQLLAVV
jgi:hypothetical protein